MKQAVVKNGVLQSHNNCQLSREKAQLFRFKSTYHSKKGEMWLKSSGASFINEVTGILALDKQENGKEEIAEIQLASNGKPDVLVKLPKKCPNNRFPPKVNPDGSPTARAKAKAGG